MRVWSWLSFLASLFSAIVATSGSASRARADDTRVTALGVRSTDGEDQLERQASRALRSATRAIESYVLSGHDVSLAQMSLAQGCEDIDNNCLSEIAKTLAAERLVYGSMVRSGDKVLITLFNFNAQTKKIESSAERSFTGPQLNEPTFSELMVELVEKLAGVRGRAFGALQIASNRPGAAVSLDGSQAGTLNDEGALLLPKVREGAHTVVVATSDGRDWRELSVIVRPEATVTLRVQLTPPLPPVSAVRLPDPESSAVNDGIAARQKLKRVLGYTSLGVAGGFAIATIYAWVRIKRISDDNTLDAYRRMWPRPGQPGGTSNACREADHLNLSRGQPGNPMIAALERSARDLCNEGQTLEKLQYVFLGGTVAFGGMGAILVWSAKRSQAQHALHLEPSFGWASVSLDAHYRF